VRTCARELFGYAARKQYHDLSLDRHPHASIGRGWIETSQA